MDIYVRLSTTEEFVVSESVAVIVEFNFAKGVLNLGLEFEEIWL